MLQRGQYGVRILMTGMRLGSGPLRHTILIELKERELDRGASGVDGEKGHGMHLVGALVETRPRDIGGYTDMPVWQFLPRANSICAIVQASGNHCANAGSGQ